MVRALQVPTWENPLDGTTLTNVFAMITGFRIDPSINRYELYVTIFVSETAQLADRKPVYEIRYRSKKGAVDETWDGVFPAFVPTFQNDNAFKTPLINLQNWMYDRMKANDVRFANATDIT